MQRAQEQSYLACNHGHLHHMKGPTSFTYNQNTKETRRSQLKQNTNCDPNSSTSAAPAKNTESMPQEERRVAESRPRPQAQSAQTGKHLAPTPAPHAWLDKATWDACTTTANIIGRQMSDNLGPSFHRKGKEWCACKLTQTLRPEHANSHMKL